MNCSFNRLSYIIHRTHF